jgi:hypothetical protein
MDPSAAVVVPGTRTPFDRRFLFYPTRNRQKKRTQNMSVCISTCLKKKLKELRLSRYDDDYDGYQFKEAVTVRK